MDNEKRRAYQRAWYERNRERKIEDAVRWQNEHRPEYLARLAQYRQENLERLREQSRRWKANNRERHRESSRRYARENAEAISAKLKAKRRALKQAILNAYGGVCACCGETTYEFLTLDHTNGDGAEHRRLLNAAKGRSNKVYQDLIDRGFPPGFRVLCFNCNSALGFYGYCPHHPPDPSAARPASTASA